MNWWSVVNHNVWEADTLAMIRHVLTRKPNSVYLDFGAWVGPTAIFASSYAKHVYAMEPDPGAFNELYYNVHMNPHISRNTEVFQLCISDGPGELGDRYMLPRRSRGYGLRRRLPVSSLSADLL